MGLLDMFAGEDRGLLGLALMQAAQPRAGGPAGIGEGLLGAINMIQQRKAAQEDREMRKQQFGVQQQQLQMALEQAKRQAAEQQRLDAWRDSIPPPQGQPLPAGPYMGAARDSQAANVPQPTAVDPQHQMLYGALKAGALNPLQYFQSLQKDTSPIKLSAGERMYDRATGKVLFENPKEDTEDSFTKAIRGAGLDPSSPQARALALQHLQKMATHAPGTQVSVNTGQKGFDNTLKLRGDFRSEPVYKAHQEMQSAYSQIQQSLKQASPAGDLAGATKIMKLLDPGSVVRESELGMAMAASGLLDRVQNYASSVINGTKLTPTQRADFQRLADALYGESVKQYNAKRSEYQGIAERNQLSVPDVLGTESSMPAAAGGWSIKPKGQ